MNNKDKIKKIWKNKRIGKLKIEKKKKRYLRFFYPIEITMSNIKIRYI